LSTTVLLAEILFKKLQPISKTINNASIYVFNINTPKMPNAEEIRILYAQLQQIANLLSDDSGCVDDAEYCLSIQMAPNASSKIVEEKLRQVFVEYNCDVSI
jgi:hypothetical protein